MVRREGAASPSGVRRSGRDTARCGTARCCTARLADEPRTEATALRTHILIAGVLVKDELREVRPNEDVAVRAAKERRNEASLGGVDRTELVEVEVGLQIRAEGRRRECMCVRVSKSE